MQKSYYKNGCDTNICWVFLYDWWFRSLPLRRLLKQWLIKNWSRNTEIFRELPHSLNSSCTTWPDQGRAWSYARQNVHIRSVSSWENKSVSIALYDLTIAHQSNDYFEELENEFKYQQLEISYYQALNFKIKGDMTRANELFRKLAQEDEQLYIVQKSKEF